VERRCPDVLPSDGSPKSASPAENLGSYLSASVIVRFMPIESVRYSCVAAIMACGRSEFMVYEVSYTTAAIETGQAISQKSREN
jgi:hypothetical protein